MTALTPAITRRHWLCSTSLVAAAVAMPCLAQTSKSLAQKSLVVAQIVDASQAQQDVSKDFLIGSRAAWQDINLRGGIRGKQVQHMTLETDGTAGSAGCTGCDQKQPGLRGAIWQRWGLVSHPGHEPGP